MGIVFAFRSNAWTLVISSTLTVCVSCWKYNSGLPDSTDRHLTCARTIRVFLGGVEPILAAMRLQFALGQIAVDLADGDGLHNLALHEFVGEFASGPLVDRPSRMVRRFTGHGQNLRDLFGAELAR
jgi:hypothetical protein